MTEPIKQPEALRLADWLEQGNYSHEDVTRASAELRRLHGEVDALTDLSAKGTKLMYECADLRAEVERLRAALTGIVDFVDGPAEAKRPDVFALRMKAARNALKEPK